VIENGDGELMTDDNAVSGAENPVIAEMAEDLVSGRRTPEEVMVDQAVAEEFSKGAARFGQWYESLSDEDKRQAADASAGGHPQSEEGARSSLVRRRRPGTADGAAES
jgi:hypothetical protein